MFARRFALAALVSVFGMASVPAASAAPLIFFQPVGSKTTITVQAACTKYMIPSKISGCITQDVHNVTPKTDLSMFTALNVSGTQKPFVMIWRLHLAPEYQNDKLKPWVAVDSDGKPVLDDRKQPFLVYPAAGVSTDVVIAQLNGERMVKSYPNDSDSVDQ